MSSYDANILQQYADELYSRADWMAIRGVLKGVLFGLGFFIVAIATMAAMHVQNSPNAAEVIGILFCGLGALVGYRLGKSKGFMLRLQAQTVLCQMQTEYNTRSGK